MHHKQWQSGFVIFYTDNLAKIWGQSDLTPKVSSHGTLESISAQSGAGSRLSKELDQITKSVTGLDVTCLKAAIEPRLALLTGTMCEAVRDDVPMRLVL